MGLELAHLLRITRHPVVAAVGAVALMSALSAGPARAASAARAVTAERAASAARAASATSVARLEGQFLLAGRVTADRGVRGEHVGETFMRTWTFTPLCSTGACAKVRLVRQRAGGTDTLVLSRRAAAYYTGSGQFYAPLECAGKRYSHGYRVPFTITVRITASRLVGLDVLASRVDATYNNPTRINLTPCVAVPAHDAATYHGHLVSS
jgi:hypothetical protein